MRVVRGSLPDVERDRAATRRLTDILEDTGEPVLRVWTPPRQVAFGPRDAAADGYDLARQRAHDHGYEPVERRVGGRAVGYTGETLAFVYGVGVEDEREGIQHRYQEVTARLEHTFHDLGVPVESGEPAGAFCPGDHSLQCDGKVAGLAQRVRRGYAVVGGCVVALERDEADLASVLEPVYDALSVQFDPTSVGSLEGAGGPGSVGDVVDAIEAAFVDGRTVEVLDGASLAGDAP